MAEGTWARHRSDVAFTASVKDAQRARGSRDAYAQAAERRDWSNTIDEDLAAFVAERDSFYRSQVQPRQNLAFIEWGAGGALFATGAVMWITSLADAPVRVAPVPNGLVVNGRF